MAFARASQKKSNHGFRRMFLLWQKTFINIMTLRYLKTAFLKVGGNTFVQYYINNSKPVFAIEYFENNPNIESVVDIQNFQKFILYLKA